MRRALHRTLSFRALAFCVAVLLLAALLAACGGGPTSAEKAYLETARRTFAPVEDLLADAELDMLEVGSGDGGDVTAEEIAHYADLLTAYRDRIGNAIDGLESEKTPAQKDLAAFHAAQLERLSATRAIVEEYLSVLDYTAALLQVGAALAVMQETPSDDLEAYCQAVNEALSGGVGVLEALDVPSFLENTNRRLTGDLKEMNDAVLYMLEAAYYADPLQLDAAGYRMEILGRRLDATLTGIDADMTERESALTDALKKIQSDEKALSEWVDENLAA